MPQATGTDATQQYAPPATRVAPAPGMPVKPAAPAGRRGLGLTWKLFLAVAAVIALIMTATLLVTYRSAKQAADASIARGLEVTSTRVNDLLDARRAQMEAGARTFATQPDFVALIQGAAAAGDSAVADWRDQAQEADSSLGADFVQLIAMDGTVMGHSVDSAAQGNSVAGSPLVRAALEGRTGSGFGIRGGSALFQAVTVPITPPNASQVGVMMVARMVDDALAREVGRTTGSEIFFYSLDQQGAPTIVATTQALSDRETLATWTAARGMTGASPGDSAAPHREEAEIGGRHYVGQGAALLGASGNALGGFVALRDRDAELGQFRQLRTTILLAGAVGLLVAFLLSALLARQIARPVRLLAAAARRASDGDYAAEIPSAGRDEVGDLATAFRSLLGDLRDKQALVDFMQASGSALGATMPMRAVTPTMQHDAMGSGAVLEPGQTLAGRYEIESVLGVGGMGVVYRALDRELGDKLAVKTLRPEMLAQDPTALERFRSEIRLARRISHRNVVRTHDIGESGGVYYITMEFVEGKSLKDLIISRGRLPAAAVLPIAKQLCRALEVAHEAGVIHRDIKPQNMVVEPDGVLKVMDFGIARLAQRTSGHTQQGMVVGTPEYMAPEQLVGDEIDVRADIYAVGCVLYECLTGRTPIVADSLITLITRVLEEDPAPPASLQPDIPAPLSAVVMRALAKEREQRPASAAELHDLLEAV